MGSFCIFLGGKALILGGMARAHTELHLSGAWCLSGLYINAAGPTTTALVVITAAKPDLSGALVTLHCSPAAPRHATPTPNITASSLHHPFPSTNA
jgi:hypothetical protein